MADGKCNVLHNTCEVAVGFAALCKVVCCIEVLLLACNCYDAYIKCDLCVRLKSSYCNGALFPVMQSCAVKKN